MKKEFYERPDKITEQWCKDAGWFSWQDFLTAVPSPVFVVTGWKENGKQNACLQSWATFIGGGTDVFICVMPVYKGGHMYRSLKRTGVCVLNFPSNDIYGRCVKTIGNNGFETDEIDAAGLTAENAAKVGAPRIKECFLNIECEFLWERELFEGGGSWIAALKAVHVCMDSDRYDETKLGRYGKTGYLYQIHCPMNPETGDVAPVGPGVIAQGDFVEWVTK